MSSLASLTPVEVRRRAVGERRTTPQQRADAVKELLQRVNPVTQPDLHGALFEAYLDLLGWAMGVPDAVMRRITQISVSLSGCWEWQRARDPHGYGRTWLDGRTFLAHRAAYLLFRGDIPPGLDVCHHCDNPPCINPEHLFLGTHLDNMRDMFAKGRRIAAKGEGHARARLTAPQIADIRRRVRAGETQAALSAEFGVSAPHINRIVHRRVWRHL